MHCNAASSASSQEKSAIMIRFDGTMAKKQPWRRNTQQLKQEEDMTKSSFVFQKVSSYLNAAKF